MDHLLDPTAAPLDRWLRQRGHAAYRAGQVRRWIFQGRASSFDEMTDLPKTLRQQLAEDYRLWTTEIVGHRCAADGTEKLVLGLADGGCIECVLLRDGRRRSVCISTQVGCAMGCVFCASGLDGIQRNLTAGEIVEQMVRLAHRLPPDERLTHIVVMGIGEPLANLAGLLPALREARRKDGLGVSVRRITISTVGLPEGIDRLARQEARYHLAVSLHAPNDELRSRLLPVNRKAGLKRVLAAADRYFDLSGRRLTFEYVLLAGINDQPHHARQLARLLRGRPALVNVIPYNPVEGLPYRTPTAASQQRFRAILQRAGLSVQFRRRKGDQISAACGQLRRTGSSRFPVGRHG